MTRHLVLACALGCSQPATVAPAAPSNRAPVIEPAPKPCDRDFGWFDRTRYLRYSVFAHGHFGEWRFHADFYRLDGADQFEGVAVGTYRQHRQAAMHTETRAINLPRLDVVKLLYGLRDRILVKRDEKPGLSMSDSSQSVVISIEAMGFDPRVGRHPNYHVEFFTDDGETQPQLWNIRGCSFAPPGSARRELEKLTQAFANTLGADAMLQQLMAKKP